MLVVIGSMFTGITLGIMLRGREIKWIPYAITLLIWALLFLLGVHTGVDKTIVHQLHNIGWDTFIITFAAISGSLLFAWLLWGYINFKKRKE